MTAPRPSSGFLFDQSSTWIINQTRAFHTNRGRAVYRLPVGSAQLERLQFECNLAPYRLEFSADDTHWKMLASRAGDVASKPQEFTTQDVGFTAAQGEAAKGSGYAWLRCRPAEGSREFLQLRRLQLDVRAAELPPGFVRPSSLPVASASSPESAKTPVYTRAEMGADLDHLTACVKRAWAYAEDKRAGLGLDVDALHAAALRELDQVHDADGFFFLVQEYVGGLMDGHAGVQAGHSSRGISTPYQWPFVVTRLDGRFYIKAIEGECGPLRPGDELLSVNGVAVRDRFETVLARSTGSTPAGREHRALGTMRWGAESQLRFEATRAGGTNFTCEVPVLRGKTAGEEPIRWKKLADHVGYLRLPSFSQDMAVWEKQGRGTNALQAALQAKKATLRQAFTELKDTRALILDLRGNSGGSDALGHFLGHFLCDTEAHPIYYSLWTRPSEDLAALPEFAYVKQMLAAASNPPGQVRLLPEKGRPALSGQTGGAYGRRLLQCVRLFSKLSLRRGPPNRVRGPSQRRRGRRPTSRRNPAPQQDGHHLLRDAGLEPQRPTHRKPAPQAQRPRQMDRGRCAPRPRPGLGSRPASFLRSLKTKATACPTTSLQPTAAAASVPTR